MDRETIIKLAREAGFSTGKRSDHIYGFDRDGDYTEELEHFAKLVAEREREACAKVCESHGPTLANGAMLAEAIRARSK